MSGRESIKPMASLGLSQNCIHLLQVECSEITLIESARQLKPRVKRLHLMHNIYFTDVDQHLPIP